MKTQQNPAGTTRQTSIKQLDALKSSRPKSDSARLVAGPTLMAAIKSCVRPANK